MKVSIQKLRKYLLDPDYRFTINAKLGFYNNWDDVRYLKRMYRAVFGKELNLDNPKTFNEKLQWLKLYDRNPEYIQMVDKYEAKKYVADIIGEEYIIPTLGVWDEFDDIDFDKLPNQFVLKCTHDSGGLVICKEKSSLDILKAKRKIVKCLNHNYYLYGREWPYKNVKPRIIAEKYMVDESGYELKDYKFFCFDGFAKAMFIASDRQAENEETKFDFFDMDFVHLPFTNGHPNSEHDIKRPESFDEMKELASKLSEGVPHVRVDFYEIAGRVYFGELTFSHWSGMVPFKPEEWDEKFGEWIHLPDSIGGGILVASKGFILWLHEGTDKPLNDYKFMCFNGEVRCSFVCSERNTKEGLHVTFYDREWNKLPFQRHYPSSDKSFEKPKHYDKMIEFAEKLSKDIPFVRVDFYEINGHPYFGELTFYPGNGIEEFTPESWDEELGSWLKLPSM